MAWIESHTVLVRHRKLFPLATELGIKPVHAVGHLTVLWHSILEQQEDGDVSKWQDSMIANFAQYEGDPEKFVAALKKNGWIEKDGLVHDWLDYAGRYLQGKYRTSNPLRLKEIWRKHKTSQRQTKDAKKTDNQPTLTNPNLPEPKKKFKKFQPPGIAEVRVWFSKNGGSEKDAEKFFHHYEAIGWRVGKNKIPMTKWRASAAGWMLRKADWDQEKKGQAYDGLTKQQRHNIEQLSLDEQCGMCGLSKKNECKCKPKVLNA